jgi:hypothetical protein
VSTSFLTKCPTNLQSIHTSYPCHYLLITNMFVPSLLYAILLTFNLLTYNSSACAICFITYIEYHVAMLIFVFKKILRQHARDTSFQLHHKDCKLQQQFTACVVNSLGLQFLEWCNMWNLSWFRWVPSTYHFRLHHSLQFLECDRCHNITRLADSDAHGHSAPKPHPCSPLWDLHTVVLLAHLEMAQQQNLQNISHDFGRNTGRLQSRSVPVGGKTAQSRQRDCVLLVPSSS